jgi:hypothetical protein
MRFDLIGERIHGTRASDAYSRFRKVEIQSFKRTAGGDQFGSGARLRRDCD